MWCIPLLALQGNDNNLMKIFNEAIMNNSANKTSFSNDQHLDLQEELSQQLLKATALTHITLSPEFFDNTDTDIHYYLCVLNDVVAHAKKLCDTVLAGIIKNNQDK